MPTRFVLSKLLSTDPEPWTGADLCTALGLSSGTVSEMLARLVEAGWVERLPAVGRAVPHRLTDTGRREAPDAIRPKELP